MDDERMTEQTIEELSEEKGLIAWVKEHKVQLLLAGVSITTLVLRQRWKRNGKDTSRGIDL